MADQQQEHQRETEGLLDSIRELRKELQFETMLIDTFIPAEFQVRMDCIINWSCIAKNVTLDCKLFLINKYLCYRNW